MLSKISGDWPSTAVGSTGYQTSTGLSSNSKVLTPTAQGPLANSRSGPRNSLEVVVVVAATVVATATVVVGDTVDVVVEEAVVASRKVVAESAVLVGTAVVIAGTCVVLGTIVVVAVAAVVFSVLLLHAETTSSRATKPEHLLTV